MRYNFSYLLVLFFAGCHSIDAGNSSKDIFFGDFETVDYGLVMELKEDSSFTLLNPKNNGHLPVIFLNCDTASRCTWKIVDNNWIEIVSEDNYLDQKGFKYDLIKERKYSDDSLYLNISLATGYHPLTFHWGFNYKSSKIIVTQDTSIVISKTKYLYNPKKIDSNFIHFSIQRELNGAKYYGSRMRFDIFETEINTEKYNYLTVRLPNFNQCFFDFETYDQDYIRIVNKNELKWRGMTWVRKKQ